MLFEELRRRLEADEDRWLRVFGEAELLSARRVSGGLRRVVATAFAVVVAVASYRVASGLGGVDEGTSRLALSGFVLLAVRMGCTWALGDDDGVLFRRRVRRLRHEVDAAVARLGHLCDDVPAIYSDRNERYAVAALDDVEWARLHRTIGVIRSIGQAQLRSEPALAGSARVHHVVDALDQIEWLRHARLRAA